MAAGTSRTQSFENQSFELMAHENFEARTSGRRHRHHHHSHHGQHPSRNRKKHRHHHGNHKKHAKHHKKPHKESHHHHHKPKPKPKPKPNPKPKPCPKPQNSTVLSLVCDGFIIDQITCKRPLSALGSIAFERSGFDAATNGKCPKPPKPNTIYIHMSSPCSKDLPKRTTAQLSEEVENVEGHIFAEAAKFEAKNNVRKHGHHKKAHHRSVKHKTAHKKHSGHHKQHKKHHKKPHKKCKNKHGCKPKPKPKPKKKHPYKNLCVATGDFCGNQLYGCHFDHKSLYTCTAVGEKPVLKKKDAPICTGKVEPPGECDCKSTTPVCGSSLPTSCRAEPNAIYHCPGGTGTPYKILKQCLPGTKCQAGRDGEPVCGFDNCVCKGDQKVCSDQFPAKCGLEPNTIYKCSATGKPIKVESCPTNKICVAVANGAICGNGDCTCNSDGTVCGDGFPLKCRIPATSLYTCTKDKKPVFAKDCLPGRCLASAATVFGRSNDQCVDSCACTSRGDVCGETFPIGCSLKAGTIYKCDGAGSKPVPGEECKDGCVVSAGDDTCAAPVGPCACPAAGIFCGSALPGLCKADLNAIYNCEAAGVAPELLQKCRPGTKCQARPGPSAVCGFDNCNCTGTAEVCSQLFPTHCDLIPNSIYKCSASGKPVLVATCDAAKECVTVSDGSVCVGKDCKCPGDGLTCGEVFPISCKLPATNLYQCKKGDDPVFERSCLPGRCTASAATVFESHTDSCISDCECSGKGLVCGSTFPPSCGLDANTLYKCEGKGEKPKDGVKCEGKCAVQAGDNACVPPSHDCTCPGEGILPICGSELPAACNAEPNTIYICRDGRGSKPEVLSICKPGTMCIKKPSPIGAICGSGTCECKGDHEVCSESFPDKCNLKPNSIYKCTSSGTPELVKTCGDSQACVSISDGAICANKDCKCSTDGTVCGEVFPLSCKLKQTALYTCKKGEEPTMLKDCYPDRCKATKASMGAAAVFAAQADDQCVDSCKCVNAGLVCGSTFPPKCKLAASTLYKCSGSDGTPTVVEDCGEGGCTVTNGDNHCNTDPCTCPGSGTAPVCGAYLPPSCNADANTIYHCPGGRGTRPEVLSICKPGTMCIKKPLPIGAICGSSSCDCKGDNEVCSESFPDKCELKPNSVYKCSSSGTPVLIKTCEAGQACVSISDGAICTNADCKCPDEGTVCGEIFPLSCKLKQTALYTCKKGENPVLLKDCYPDRCKATKASFGAAAVFAAQANDQCADSCKCVNAGLVCGSTFPPKCKLAASTLYKCDGSDGTPKVVEDCGEGGCTVTNGDNHCNTDPCTCPGTGRLPVCGSDLPASCRADANTIYHCPGGHGTKPEVLSVCKPGSMCIKKPAPIGAICGSGSCDCKGNNEVCSDSFPDNCNLEKNAIYKCTDSGKAEFVKKCDSTQSCVTVSDGAICTSNDCKCPDDGTVCGEIFPLSCRLTQTALYTCRKGDTPKLLKDCYPDRCKATKASFGAQSVFEAKAANDQCVDSCTCVNAGFVCGSTFPPKCKLRASTLYKCEGSDGTPTPAEECKEGGCTVTNGEDKCHEGTDCTCPGTGRVPVCGRELPDSCKADPNTIYHCPGGSGTKPEVLTVCKPGTICLKKPPPEGAACGADSCDCKGDNEVCSSAFPERCGLEKNAIYKCSADGKPVLVKKCDSTQSCVSVSDGAICASEDCKCPDDGTVCGEVFPLSCKLKQTALYTCKKGDTP
ncbi:hypothetical protein BGZ94_007243, partial [Podila epigama]